MTAPTTLDGLLVQWGDRLFYPGNRIVRSPPAVRGGATLADRARAIRARLHATVVRGAPQVMVKVTGGGRGMAAIAAHFRYISKQGRLAIEDDRGVVHEGKEGVRDLVLLCHKRSLAFVRRQHGHRGSVLSKAAAISSRKVVMDDETWRCVRWAAARFVMRG